MFVRRSMRLATPPRGAVIGEGLGETVKSNREVRSLTAFSGDARREAGLGAGIDPADVDTGFTERVESETGGLITLVLALAAEPFPIEL